MIRTCKPIHVQIRSPNSRAKRKSDTITIYGFRRHEITTAVRRAIIALTKAESGAA